MRLDLMSFQIHLRFEDHKFLLQTFWVQAEKVVALKMILKGLIINVVLLLTVGGTTITDMATFVFVSAVSVELVVAVEALATKSTLRVSFETTLIDRAGLIIAVLLMLS